MADSASMKYFGSTPFIDLLPPVIAVDASFARAAAAVDGPLAASAKAVSNTLIFARLAADSGFSRPVSMLAPLERLAALTSGLAPLPEPVLDLLAWQLHVESYDEAASVQAKREMIWSSVILHRKRGAPWAVKHGLETTLQVPAEISEWFDYQGEPYFFRVTLEVSGTFVDARWLEAVRGPRFRSPKTCFSANRERVRPKRASVSGNIWKDGRRTGWGWSTRRCVFYGFHGFILG